MPYSHLHVHTQFSILDGLAKIEDLLKIAEKNGQPALAITDHGNMYGAKKFLDTAEALGNKVKPIVGCEVYVAHESRFTKKGREDQSSFHLILLAKNLNGYHNLIKLVSKGFIEGFHYKPRIDRELLEKYHEDIICSSACLGGEVPQAIMKGNFEEARNVAKWYKHLFGPDYYLEVQRHETNIPGAAKDTFIKQQEVNEEIFKIASELDIKVIATNDVHFSRKEDGPAHDRLICINTNAFVTEEKRLHYTQQEYLKSTEEMSEVFSDHPEVLENTNEIVDKVEIYTLNHDPILPNFPIPKDFSCADDYLKFLTYEGAKKRYPNIDDKTRDRIEFELDTIKRMGFPDYFLIVQDFIIAARKMGVSVGPGRGSAAGSVVAYCLTITDIDPIKYDLLFERFLNPERVNMPDIDVDFDDEGRYKVFKYIEDKYGKDHVSHVVTFGTMATKGAIKDVARIEQLPLEEAVRLTKLVPTKKFQDKKEVEIDDPDNPGQKKKIKQDIEVKVKMKSCLKYVDEFKEAAESKDPILRDTIKYATELEGSIRQTGVHACATIIGRDDLTNFIPICMVKDKKNNTELMVSQFDGTLIESAGMLKMDFLGLSTLSLIKETLKNIKVSKGEDVDIDHIPLDDKLTFDLFSRGDTIGVFQFESDGMQQWLVKLKPTRFEDIIAMNALYRPGPMDYIPDFVDRKQGKKKIEYDLPEMEEILEDTYGITVYQEQVMLLSQKIANFSKGMADKLRKAMGKKKIAVMAKLKVDFFKGGEENGHPKEVLEKIWNDWKAFAQYAFNKSHATCYAWIGYQTAYLKAHYPAEFMSANLTKSIGNPDDIIKFMDDCKKKNIKVLGPDINESYTNFNVNKSGNIRFGMAGIKGIGSKAVDAIIENRVKNGAFVDIYDFVERMGTSVNRKGVEVLVGSGAFDSFEEVNRGSFLLEDQNGNQLIDVLLNYGKKFQEDNLSTQASLFGADDIETTKPALPIPPQLNMRDVLKTEKNLVGMYLSAHPLDRYSFEIQTFTDITLGELMKLPDQIMLDPSLFVPGKRYNVAGLVTASVLRQSRKNNRTWCMMTIEDYSGSVNLPLFGKDYENNMSYAQEGKALYLTLEIVPRYEYLSSDEKKKLSKEQIQARKPRSYDLKIREISLLSTIRETKVHELILNLPVTAVNKEFRKDFVSTLKKSKGKVKLSLYITDEDKNLHASFFSRKYKVDITSDLLEFMQRNHIQYKIS